MVNEVTKQDDVKIAAAAVAEAHTKCEQAERDIETAKGALQRANDAADKAHHSADPQGLVDAVVDAEAGLRVAYVKLRVCEAQKRSAIEAHKSAQHHAAEPLHTQGRQKRLQACKMADEARDMLAKADALFLEGAVDLQRARNAGRFAPFDYSLLGPRLIPQDGRTHEIPDAASEVALWEGVG